LNHFRASPSVVLLPLQMQAQVQQFETVAGRSAMVSCNKHVALCWQRQQQQRLRTYMIDSNSLAHLPLQGPCNAMLQGVFALPAVFATTLLTIPA
jgi:hypothetical protein